MTPRGLDEHQTATGELIAEIWPITRTGHPHEHVYLHHDDSLFGAEVSSTVAIIASCAHSKAGVGTTSGNCSSVSVIDVQARVRIEHGFGDFGVLRFPILPLCDYEVSIVCTACIK